MPLTAAGVRAAEPRARPYKIADAGGLFLYVAPSGLRSWRMAYRRDRKAQLLVFGRFPDLSLAEARAARDDARQQLRRGEDPSPARRRGTDIAAPAAPTFADVARAWAKLEAPGWSPVHHGDVVASLERDIFPPIGAMPLAAIAPATIVAALRRIEARGAIETAKRVRQRLSGIFEYAISEGFCDTNPAAVTRRALQRIGARGRQPALTDIDQARQVLAAAEQLDADPIAQLASRLLALTVVRLAVVRGATWSEFEGIDWEDPASTPAAPLWRIPAARMKLSVARKADRQNDHLVPLPAQAVAVLRAARAIAGGGALVFPGARDRRRPLAENAICALYVAAGFGGRHVPHGWRATFSTTMKARARRAGRPDDLAAIELMLAHMPRDKVAAAYDRDDQLERRRELHQAWADILSDGLAPAAELTAAKERRRGAVATCAGARLDRRPTARKTTPAALNEHNVAAG